MTNWNDYTIPLFAKRWHHIWDEPPEYEEVEVRDENGKAYIARLDRKTMCWFTRGSACPMKIPIAFWRRLDTIEEIKSGLK